MLQKYQIFNWLKNWPKNLRFFREKSRYFRDKLIFFVKKLNFKGKKSDVSECIQMYPNVSICIQWVMLQFSISESCCDAPTLHRHTLPIAADISPYSDAMEDERDTRETDKDEDDGGRRRKTRRIIWLSECIRLYPNVSKCIHMYPNVSKSQFFM